MRYALLVSATALGLLGACTSGDQAALEDLAAKRLANPNNLEVSDAVIYREGDARMACIIATYDNQWGERQPPQQINAWYIPQSESWHTDNPAPPDEVGCERFKDADWQSKARGDGASRRQATTEGSLSVTIPSEIPD